MTTTTGELALVLAFCGVAIAFTPQLVQWHWSHDDAVQQHRWRVAYVTAYASFALAAVVMWAFPGAGAAPWLVAAGVALAAMGVASYFRGRGQHQRGRA